MLLIMENSVLGFIFSYVIEKICHQTTDKTRHAVEFFSHTELPDVQMYFNF